MEGAQREAGPSGAPLASLGSLNAETCEQVAEIAEAPLGGLGVAAVTVELIEASDPLLAGEKQFPHQLEPAEAGAKIEIPFHAVHTARFALQQGAFQERCEILLPWKVATNASALRGPAPSDRI